MKKVMIFGSTGSIGRNTLDIIRQTEGKFKVLGLSTNSDTLTLKEQAKQFNPAYICIADEKKAQGLENKISSQTKIFKGKTGLEEFASIGCDIAVMAISGISCLRPLLISLRSAKRIALANKESVVTAANFLFRQAKSFNTEIIPVDSEINALYQLLEKQKDFEKVYPLLAARF
jgi:1-deoxy-D-xylulose-5-phosphate reductoisomerase